MGVTRLTKGCFCGILTRVRLRRRRCAGRSETAVSSHGDQGPVCRLALETRSPRFPEPHPFRPVHSTPVYPLGSDRQTKENQLMCILNP